ncbi:sigma factor-like helix-turn-helix DNA-binding protein [Pseudogracilibacillus auburnensis]|uniref:sigma factor-like helix-turn-helix DNA-binding protein n=1 Tax=Pseudogracilibacillus auburnensis TaxID=1494959 RepID=UPI001A97CF1E|nr:sigma factor-like helix-turn-helix DNA-binding protein [Pseudogracilibacillus auburnensis]MBO1005778.1 hypothetical protein [Pseudogracilibacillus auburnensis]
MLTPEQIKQAVEDFPNLLARQERLQNRIINLAGRDSNQEIIYMQQLQSIEELIDLIDYATDSNDILTDRENWAVYRRVGGATHEEIAEMLVCSRERIRQILSNAYVMITNFYNGDAA